MERAEGTETDIGKIKTVCPKCESEPVAVIAVNLNPIYSGEIVGRRVIQVCQKHLDLYAKVLDLIDVNGNHGESFQLKGGE